MNPWLSRSTGQYFPGTSPSGAAGQTWGNYGGWGASAQIAAPNVQYNTGQSRGFSRGQIPLDQQSSYYGG